MSKPATAPSARHWTYAEYLDLERRTGVRHEYWDGTVHAKSGGTKDHARIITNIIATLGVQLDGHPCEVWVSELKERHEARNTSTYADAAVFCEDPSPSATDPNAFTNPAVLIEALSPSTERYDRVRKLDLYRAYDTVQHVVFVAHDVHCIELWSRTEHGHWRYQSFGAGQTVPLPAIGCVLDVAVVYRLTDVPAQPPVDYVSDPGWVRYEPELHGVSARS